MKTNHRSAFSGTLLSAGFCKFIFFILLFLPCFVFAQDIKYARHIVDTLASPSFEGRGYNFNGDKKSAGFIRREFKSMGVKCFDTGYFQTVTFPVNSFSGVTNVRINHRKLKPGADFVVMPYSSAAHGKYKTIRLDSAVFYNKTALDNFKKTDFKKYFIVVDEKGITDKKDKEMFEAVRFNGLKAKGVITVTDSKPKFGILKIKAEFPAVEIRRSLLPKKSFTIKTRIDNEFVELYSSQNVIGYIPGSAQPDSFIVITAHYDHLGRMGKVYFPGANDNASGVAMMMDFAKYYTQKENTPKYSIVFIAFTGEEIGLEGSKTFVAKPFFPLGKIKFLINLDLAGTGDDGVTIVNSIVSKNEFDRLTAINANKKYLPQVKARGKASISDHHPFTEKNVPCFYIYTMGGISEYHNIYDKAETLPLTAYENYFRLLRDFIKTF
ncbi:MAG: M20/M25/M40 family metallo-hydrolase [Bacteroidota bacterium]